MKTTTTRQQQQQQPNGWRTINKSLVSSTRNDSTSRSARESDCAVRRIITAAKKRLQNLLYKPISPGFTYLQSMDFQRESQSKHHLYCKQEKPAHCHGSLLLRLGTHQIQNRTRDAHKISPHGTMTKRTPAMKMFGLWFSLKVHGLQIGKSDVHGLSERTTVQTSSLLLRLFFFYLLANPTQPDPYR